MLWCNKSQKLHFRKPHSLVPVFSDLMTMLRLHLIFLLSIIVSLSSVPQYGGGSQSQGNNGACENVERPHNNIHLSISLWLASTGAQEVALCVFPICPMDIVHVYICDFYEFFTQSSCCLSVVFQLSPRCFLTIIWFTPDPYLTLIRSLQPQKSCVVCGLTKYKPYIMVISEV